MEQDFNVEIITQNVDDLHERAGSTNVLHLYGELTKVRPEDCCCKEDNYSLKYISDIGYRAVSIWETGGPHNRQLRPHILWPGEDMPDMGPALQAVNKADILLLAGTSLQKYPVPTLCAQVHEECVVYMVSPDAAPARKVFDGTLIKGNATSSMEKCRDIAKIIYVWAEE